MLSERVKEWTQEWLREGEQQVLLRQLELKFGKPDADTLRRIEQADDEQLLAWSGNLLSADRLEQVFYDSLDKLCELVRDSAKEWPRVWQREGERRVLLWQLELRFGKPDADARDRVKQADDDQLLAWSENLLSADRLEDVFH